MTSNGVCRHDAAMKSPEKYEHLCDNHNCSKRRCLTWASIESKIYHHPLFDEIDAIANDTKHVTINVLNDDCLDTILSYLDVYEILSLSSVCRRWYNLCLSKVSRIKSFYIENDRQWHIGSPAQKFYRYLGYDGIASILSLNCGSLTTLSLSDVKDLTATNLSHMSDLLPNVVNLRLGGKFLLDNTILAVIREKLAPKVKSLYLRGLCSTNNKVLINVLRNAHQLVHLYVYEDVYCNRYKDNDRLFHECDGLRVIPDVLSLSNPLTSFSLKCDHKLHPTVLRFILIKFSSTLIYLNLSENNQEVINVSMKSLPSLNSMKVFIAPQWGLSSAGQTVSLLNLMPNLRVLDLTQNCQFTEEGYDIAGILSNNCPLLEELNLSCCAIPAKRLINLKELKCLKRLCIDNVSASGVWFVADEFPQFDAILAFNVFAAKVLPHMKQLEYFSMKEADVSFEEDDVVLFIRNAGPNFRSLCLSPTVTMHTGINREEIGHNYFEGALKKCNSIQKSEPITIIIENLSELHFNSCNDIKNCSCGTECSSYYNEISPNFLTVLDYHNDKSSKSMQPFAVEEGALTIHARQYIAICNFESDTFYAN